MMPIAPIGPLAFIFPLLYLAFFIYVVWVIVSLVTALKRIAAALEAQVQLAQAAAERDQASR